MKKIYFLVVSILLIGFNACDPVPEIIVELGDYERGYYILNEGVYGENSASITHYDPIGKVFTDSIYYKMNEIGLGDVLQDMIVVNNKAFVVLNNSLKVEVIDLTSFEKITSIAGDEITYPRQLVYGGNNRIYLSNGQKEGSIVVINAVSNIIEGSIAVGSGPEGVLVHNNMLFVANSGYYDFETYSNISDSTVYVIDMVLNQVIEKIDLNEKTPSKLTVDATGNIWVLCKGVVGYDANWNSTLTERAALVKVSQSTLEVLSAVEIVPVGGSASPSVLLVNGTKDQLYYGAGFGFNGIYKFNISSTSAPSNAFIDGYFYGFGINPADDSAWALSDDGSNGLLSVYDAQGNLTEIENQKVGRFPNGIVFYE